MKRLCFALLVILLCNTTSFSQVFSGKRQLDSLSSGTIVTVTAVVRIADQFLQDYSVNSWESGKLKLKNVAGKEIKIESLAALSNIIAENGYEIKHFTAVPFSTLSNVTINEVSTNQLCYTIVFQRQNK